MQISFTGRNLEYRGPLTAAVMDMAGTMPGRKKWIDRVLSFEPSKANVEHVMNRLPDAVWSDSAHPVLARLENERRERDEIHQLRESSSVEVLDYQFRTRPYAHQAKAFLVSRNARAFALFMDMGTGKTKVAIDTICWQYGQGMIDAVLVLAPNGVHDNWALRELPTHMPEGVPMEILAWDAEKASASYSKASLKKFTDFLGPAVGKLKILCMNIEAVSTEKGMKYAEKFVLGSRCLVIVDESTKIKTPGVARTKNVIKLGKRAVSRRIMSGLPAPEGLEGLFSQMQFLGEDILGFSSFYTFRNRYCIMGGYEGREVVGYTNVAELMNQIASYSFHVRKADCLDLPEKVYETREFDLTPEQRKIYDDMKKRLSAEVNGQKMTAQQAIVKVVRLHQIACGWFQPDEGELQMLASKRLNVLKEILEQTSDKVTIWSRFVADIKAIKQILGRDAVCYYGEADGDERNSAIDSFQNGEAKYFIGQPRSGGIGLTLTAASTVIYYSNTYSLEDRLQSEDRAHRIGQKHNVTYIDLVARKTIDEVIVKALREKKDIAQMVLDSLR